MQKTIGIQRRKYPPHFGGNACKTLPMWQKFNKVINGFFDGISLKDLVEGGISVDG